MKTISQVIDACKDVEGDRRDLALVTLATTNVLGDTIDISAEQFANIIDEAFTQAGRVMRAGRIIHLDGIGTFTPRNPTVDNPTTIAFTQEIRTEDIRALKVVKKRYKKMS